MKIFSQSMPNHDSVSGMVPENLKLLHQGEETLRTDSLRRIQATPDLLAHLAMLESCMDLIYALLPSTEVTDEDQLMLGNLGVRLFNALASALKLMLSGYYQASALQLRDVMETAFLLNYFGKSDSLVSEWRTMPEQDRKRKFSPAKVRTALDERDGFTEKKRAEAYDLLCRLAGHATPEGVVMLVPDRSKSNVHCGPFLEDTALQAVISEAAKLGVQAAQAFREVMNDETHDQLGSRIAFMQAEGDWFERFFGKVPDRAALAEMRALFDTVTQDER